MDLSKSPARDIFNSKQNSYELNVQYICKNMKKHAMCMASTEMTTVIAVNIEQWHYKICKLTHHYINSISVLKNAHMLHLQINTKTLRS